MKRIMDSKCQKCQGRITLYKFNDPGGIWYDWRSYELMGDKCTCPTPVLSDADVYEARRRYRNPNQRGLEAMVNFLVVGCLIGLTIIAAIVGTLMWAFL